MPIFSCTFENNLKEPPYISCAATTSSPGTSKRMTASVAATPLAKANPNFPFSITAKASSKANLVGF